MTKQQPMTLRECAGGEIRVLEPGHKSLLLCAERALAAKIQPAIAVDVTHSGGGIHRESRAVFCTRCLAEQVRLIAVHARQKCARTVGFERF